MTLLTSEIRARRATLNGIQSLVCRTHTLTVYALTALQHKHRIRPQEYHVQTGNYENQWHEYGTPKSNVLCYIDINWKWL